MKPTHRDPTNTATRNALAHLLAARDARERYDTNLQAAIWRYGDLHHPEKDANGQCLVCAVRGLLHTEHERLNHQTGSAISGIYADHFPEGVKAVLRVYARLIGEHTDRAYQCWRQAGRKRETWGPWAEDARQLEDGRQSYY